MMLTRREFASPLRMVLGLMFVGVLLMAGWPAGMGNSAEDPGVRNGRPLDPQGGVWFEEVVTYPLSDWQGNDRVSSLDEYVVLRNYAGQSVDVTGWVLHMIDGTDEETVLEGSLGPGEAFFLLNPPGQINNDVRLLLLDEADGVVDDVTLGSDGVPEGRGDSVIEEAVHLAGPWAGLHAPATGGRGLGPFWVSHLSAAPVLHEAPFFQAAWVAPDQTPLALKIRSAPGFNTPEWKLRVDGQLGSLHPVEGTTDAWKSDPLLFEDGQQVRLESSAHEVDTFPAGDGLSVNIDPQPPYFEDGANSLEPHAGKVAIADAERRIHWFPELIEGPSGIVSVTVETVTGDSLPDCLPLSSPGPECVVGPDVSEWVVTVRDGAGRLVNESLPIEFWETAPEVPEFRFLEGPPPGFVWDHGSRAFERIIVESAQDVTGAWPVREVTLVGNATGFQDTQWVPGEPRAYRLNVTDLAGNSATGPWVALDPQDVPVQARLELPEDLSSLASSGKSEVTVAFDRGLDVAPKLVFQANVPQPIFQETLGEPIAGQHAFSYWVELPGPLQEAAGSWSLVGGRGIDQAPIDPLHENVTWDEKPPRLEFSGVDSHWVQGVRHVVSVSAVDGLDDAPKVVFTQVPKNGSVEERGATTRVTLQGEGWMELAGHGEDDAGNRASFRLQVGLDASAPGVSGLQRPEVWSTKDPFVFEVQDQASGLNTTSVQTWVRNASAVFESRIEFDEAGRVLVLPQNLTEARGPFEIYVAVADRAGNGVEGFLSDRLVPVASTDSQNESMTVVVLEDSGPGSAAPSFLGPPWFEQRGEEEGGISLAGREGSNEGEAGSPWDGFSWDDVEKEEVGGSFGWYLLGVVGFLGLGTVVHQVGQHRKKAHKKDTQKQAPDGSGGSDTKSKDDKEPGGAAATRSSVESPDPIDPSESPTQGCERPVVWIASQQPHGIKPERAPNILDETHAPSLDSETAGVHEVMEPVIHVPIMDACSPLWDMDCDRDPDEGDGCAGWAQVVVECPPAVGVM